MKKNSQINTDEINLVEIIQTVWKCKWKIAIVVFISLIATKGYQSTQVKNYTAITEIKPINALEINKYITLNQIREYLILNNSVTTNSYVNSDKDNSAKDNSAKAISGKDSSRKVFDDTVIDKLTSSNLLKIYVEILRDKSIFEDAIRKFNLLDASQYDNVQKYNEDISKLASSIKILSPLNKDKKNLGISYHAINFIYNDVNKWKNVLKHSDELANKLAKEILLEKYKNYLSSLKQKKMYEIEDLSIQINNLVNDYDRDISDRLEYLYEQSEIAKKLGITKNTLETQTIGNTNTLLSSIRTDSPFYLRGYEAIDKEIELISMRTNEKAFMRGLFDLEKKKREIEQDQTIQRTELVLQSTLMKDNNEFSAASLNISATKFKYKNNNKILVIAIVFGFIIGIPYALVSDAFQSRRVSRKKTN